MCSQGDEGYRLLKEYANGFMVSQVGRGSIGWGSIAGR